MCFADTAAMASLALTCVYDGILATRQSKMVGAIQEALARMTKQILGELQSSGIIGNIYSTGLAMQVCVHCGQERRHSQESSLHPVIVLSLTLVFLACPFSGTQCNFRVLHPWSLELREESGQSAK